MVKVLAFDIGIKNLAFCILEGKHVHALENCNLLTPVEKIHCSSCKSLAKFTVNSIPVCKRHVLKTHTCIDKSPTLQELRAFAKEKGVMTTKQTKENLIDALKDTYAFPLVQPKEPKASVQSLTQLHDALRVFVNKWWTMFLSCTYVLLENQPAFKNPHMKSVQVLLFATLREKFIQNGSCPTFHLVHAKKKVKDAEAGDAGYAERKSKSEQKLKDLFQSNTLGPTTIFDAWNAAKKKSDMADALCMCDDFLSNTK